MEIVGRDRERAALDGLLQAAGDGRGGVLVLSGEAGVGKTTLLGHAREQAVGFRLGEAVGVEEANQVAFAGLAELTASLGTAAPDDTGDALAAAAAFLALLESLAADGPLLLIVDDLQWLDASTIALLRFVAPRIGDVPVALVAATRTGSPHRLAGTGATVLEVGGMTPDEVLRLLDGRTVTASVARQLASATAGNPLAVLEVAARLPAAALAGSEPLPDPLPAAGRLEELFAERIAALSDDARTTLLALAALAADSTAELMATTERLGAPGEGLLECEEAGLVVLGPGRVTFAHPLIRSAAYHGATPAARRRAHAAVAEALDDEARADRRAWQLARAAIGPDETVAALLEQTAARAAARGGDAARARTLAVAADLTPPGRSHTERLVTAGEATMLAGDSQRALGLLDTALAECDDAALRGRIQMARAHCLDWLGQHRQAHDLLVREAAAVADVDRPLAAYMLAFAANHHLLTVDARGGSELIAQCFALDPTEEPIVGRHHARAAALILRGRAADALPELARYADHARANPEIGYGFQVADLFAQVGDLATARELIEAEIDRWRDWVSLPYGLTILAEIDLRSGVPMLAFARAREAAAVAEEADLELFTATANGVAARAAALLGREEDCLATADRILAVADEHGWLRPALDARLARGTLHLQAGRAAEAVAELEPVAAALEAGGAESLEAIPYAAELIGAYAAAGLDRAATAELERALPRARRSPDPNVRASIERCRAELSPLSADDGPFVRAAAALPDDASPLERAQLELSWGRRLLALGRPAQAQDVLRDAGRRFAAAGAAPLAAQARKLLLETGDAAAAAGTAPATVLSPRELQIAMLVASGATNREAASRLFLTERTIEFHLSNAYRKLGKRSRTELAALFAAI